jgi:cysteine desulfurase
MNKNIYLDYVANTPVDTEGSSESNNLAIKGIAQSYKENEKHIITTFLERSSVSSPLTY